MNQKDDFLFLLRHDCRSSNDFPSSIGYEIIRGRSKKRVAKKGKNSPAVSLMEKAKTRVQNGQKVGARIKRDANGIQFGLQAATNDPAGNQSR